jgi:peptidoglycan DL-endopeptidase CwlO
MPTVGWVFILIGIIVMRQSIQGRALKDIPGDIGSILRGAATSLQSPAAGAAIIKEVLSRAGATLTYAQEAAQNGVKVDPINPTSAQGNTQGTVILYQMKRLAAAAGNKYILGTQGPNSYDCSGLVWAAMKANGYTGGRFTTFTFVNQMGSGITKNTGTPQAGDIVLWVTHMGCMESATTMFSALNPREGIKSSPLSYGPKGEPAPTFWNLHYTAPRVVNG